MTGKSAQVKGDPFIMGLDLLAEWGAMVHVPGATLCLGVDAVALYTVCREGLCPTANLKQPPGEPHITRASQGLHRFPRGCLLRPDKPAHMRGTAGRAEDWDTATQQTAA